MKINVKHTQNKFGCAKCYDIPDNQVVTMWRYLQRGKCKKCGGQIEVLKVYSMDCVYNSAECGQCIISYDEQK